MRLRLVRLIAPRLVEALEFYAERTCAAMRGTTGRWADYERWPQPRATAYGDPSIWDQGQIARRALEDLR